MDFRFLHAADLHLDSPLLGLDRYPGAPVDDIRGATRQALANLVDLALAEPVDFVVIAGDVYDGDWRDYHTGLFFGSQMARLRAGEVPVFLVSGNHDAASQVSKSLTLPENVHVFPVRKPGSVPLERLGVVVHGQGFARRDVTDDLSAGFPPAVPDRFNIGVLHTAATGRDGHDRYAPCTLEGLAAKGYGYWALGHVHQREVLRESGPAVVFPGNTQGRNARETGPKGATLVTVTGGEVAGLEHRDLDVVRWAAVRVAPPPGGGWADLLDEIVATAGSEADAAGGRTLAIRVVVVGETPLHPALQSDPERWRNDVRAAVGDATGGRAWVEKVKFETAAPAVAGGRDPVLGELFGALEGGRELVAGEAGGLPAIFPAALRDALAADPEAVVGSARALLRARLLGGTPPAGKGAVQAGGERGPA